MAHEVDFFQVGSASKTGDATCLRFNVKDNSQIISLIDAGDRAAGEKMVSHIKRFYGENPYVNYAFLTHPHADHMQGFFPIFENLTVNYFIVNIPWKYSAEILEMLDDARRTENSIGNSLKKNLKALDELICLAEEKGITILNYFEAINLDILPEEIMLLGPSEEYYISLLKDFPAEPLKPKKTVAQDESLTAKAAIALESFADRWVIETLEDPEPGEVTAMNNSSSIILFNLDGRRYFFTGDAGVEAIEQALDKAETELGIDCLKPDYFHIPHHGSRHNLGPTILNRICGSKSLFNVFKDTFKHNSVVSVAKEYNESHPSPKVLNALRRRGYQTPKFTQMHVYKDLPGREGYVPVEHYDFLQE